MSIKDKVRRAAEWLGDFAEKAKAIAAAVSTFTAVVVTVAAKDTLGLDDVTSVVTAGTTLAFTVYYLVWRVPNEGQLGDREE
jgi:hypothetical protein